jgi:hypothetical protein
MKKQPKSRGARGRGRATESRASTTKKAFDLSRDSVYAADPTTELRICGARGVVPADEAGDLDTAPGPGVPVKDEIRLAKPLRPHLKASIDRYGVRVPIIICKIGDVAVVIDGKDRVRAARASNRTRAKDGRPLIKPRCVMQRDTSPLAILATMINANNGRDEDTLSDKVAKLVAFIEAGASEADAADAFTVGQDRLRDWLDYHDRAIDAVKQAAADERIPASTAMEIAKIKSVEGQTAALAKILSGATTRDRSARAARVIAQGANDTPTVTDRRSQRLLLAYLQEPSRAPDTARRKEIDHEFWQGVVEALKAVTGQDADPRVVRAIAAARTERPAKDTKARKPPRLQATPSGS